MSELVALCEFENLGRFDEPLFIQAMEERKELIDQELRLIGPSVDSIALHILPLFR